jgi:hypothetical protein
MTTPDDKTLDDLVRRLNGDAAWLHTQSMTGFPLIEKDLLEACEAICALLYEDAALRKRVSALERHGYVVAMRLMQSEVRLDAAEHAGLDAFITKVAARAALGERK